VNDFSKKESFSLKIDTSVQTDVPFQNLYQLYDLCISEQRSHKYAVCWHFSHTKPIASATYRFGSLSLRQLIASAAYHFGSLSLRQPIASAAYRFGSLSLRQPIASAAYRFGKIQHITPCVTPYLSCLPCAPGVTPDAVLVFTRHSTLSCLAGCLTCHARHEAHNFSMPNLLDIH
jgi:hypothetical protein